MMRLLPLLTAAFSVQAEITETAATSSSMEIIYSILHANILVQTTFVILIFMSVFSWGIILTKRKMFHKIEIYNAPFQDIFQKANNLQSIYEVSSKYSKSSLANIFKTGYKEIQKLSKSKLAESETTHEGLLSGIGQFRKISKKSCDE